MLITQMLVSSSKYSRKCPYAMTPEGITIHNTAMMLLQKMKSHI